MGHCDPRVAGWNKKKNPDKNAQAKDKAQYDAVIDAVKEVTEAIEAIKNNADFNDIVDRTKIDEITSRMEALKRNAQVKLKELQKVY